MWGLGCGRDGSSGSGSLFTHPLQAWKVADLSSLTFKCLISDFSIVAKPNRVSVVGGFCTHPPMGAGDERTGCGGFCSFIISELTFAGAQPSLAKVLGSKFCS